mgnify:FL=1
MMRLGFNFGNGMSASVGENEMSYDFIYSAILQDPEVQVKLDEVRSMIAELEREVSQLQSIIDTLKQVLQAAA